MNPRKHLPKQVWEIIEELFTGKMENFKFSLTMDNTVEIKETDPDSPFFFRFFNFKYRLISGDEAKIFTTDIMLNPQVERPTKGLSLIDLSVILSDWINEVGKYNTPTHLFDEDPVLNYYMKEQEDFFEVLDDDAEYAPFSFERQKDLSNVYDLIIAEILEEENLSPQVVTFVQELKDSQAEIGAQTKQQAVTSFSRNIAKARKVGVSIFEKIVVKLAAEGAISLWPKVAGIAQALLT